MRQFIPFAGNTHHLQWRRTEESNWFMDTVRKVNSRGDQNETTQGFYAVDAAGDAYGYNNNRNVEAVLDFMKTKLADYRSSPHMKVDLTAQEGSIPKPPAGSAVLRVYQRIIPVPKGADSANENVQRDHFWLLPEEITALSSGSFPDTLGLRLCRFVFNDAIRGEPDMWKLEEVRIREFTASKELGGVKFSGRFKMETADKARGLEGKIEGTAVFDGGKTLEFKAVADTTAWGRCTHTPNPPVGRFPLKFAFTVAPNAIDTVAPQATFFGNSYLTGR